MRRDCYEFTSKKIVADKQIQIILMAKHPLNKTNKKQVLFFPFCFKTSPYQREQKTS
jgi:hypothetical protein